MKTTITHDGIGKIDYTESFWTGQKGLSINDTPLQKVDKNTFRTEDGQQVTLSGNNMSGVKLTMGEHTVQLVRAVTWYEIVLSILPFVLIMVWGNITALVKIVPVVGGVLGGAISAAMCVVNVFVIKNVKKVWLKVLISVAMLGATFLICYLIALIILAMV